jgi:hypothetical protein
MAKFQDPPLRDPIFLTIPTKDEKGALSNSWQRYLVASTNRHTQPNIPVVTAPPTAGKAGDLRTDGTFLYLFVADNVVKRFVPA